MKKILLLLLVSFSLFSCDEILMEDDISGETLTLVAPSDAIELTSTSLRLSWNAIKNGSQYRVQIARPNFDSPAELIADEVVDTTFYAVQLNVGEYEWRVKGVNSAYETPYTTRKFKIVSNDDFQNNVVSLNSPQDNLVTNIALQNLSWAHVLGSTSYHMRVLTLNGSSVVFEQEVTDEFINYSFPEGSFTWQVMASNSSQNTLYTSRNIITDYTAPHTPVPVMPANQSYLNAESVTFTWNRQAAGGSIETDSIYIYSNSNLTSLYYKGQHTTPYTPSLPRGVYYWYLKSFDAAGNVSQQSTKFSFTAN
jgi:hypothetical protein